MRELRVALLGWGYLGPKIARNLESLPLVTIPMVADPDQLRLARLHHQRPWICTTTEPMDAFASDVDAVVIAIPVRTYFQLARQALLTGKHVLVEKPLKASVDEAEDLVALAHQQRLVLMVGHTFEYHPAVQELRAMVQNGELGTKIYTIETQRLNLGLFRNDIDVIWDLAPPDLSILLYLPGRNLVTVRAQGVGHLRRSIVDVAFLDLTYEDGMTAHVHASWMHPTKVRQVTVLGDERMIVYDDTIPAEMLKIFNKGAEVGVDPAVSYRYGAISIPHIEWAEPLRLECDDFASAIRNGTVSCASGENGLEVVRVLAAAAEALALQAPAQIATSPLVRAS